MTTATMRTGPLTADQIGALVRSTQAGDRLAFGELYEAFEGAVLGIALRRLRNHAEAQELRQDVFIRALCKIGQLREANRFGPWLFAITRRMSVNRLVRRRRVVYTEPDFLDQVDASDTSPLGAVMAAERGQQVRGGLDQLGDLDRNTLVAFYVDGQSLAEMSDRFDAPLGTIKRRLHVARQRLAKRVENLVAV